MLQSPIELTFLVTGNPMLIYIGTDGQAYRVDVGETPVETREVAIYATLHKLGELVSPNGRADQKHSPGNGNPVA